MRVKRPCLAPNLSSRRAHALSLPTVGEEHMTEVPKVHEELKPKISYDTFIDCPSNPEMFVAPQGKALAYPAYIIHFS